MLSAKFQSPKSPAAPVTRPKRNAGHFTFAWIFAPKKFFAHRSETVHPIWTKIGQSIPHTPLYISAKGFLPTTSNGPAAKPKASKFRFSPSSSAVDHPIITKLGNNVRPVSIQVLAKGISPASSDASATGTKAAQTVVKLPFFGPQPGVVPSQLQRCRSRRMSLRPRLPAHLVDLGAGTHA